MAAKLIRLTAYLSKIEMNYPMFEMVVSEPPWKVPRQNFIRALGQIATPLGATVHVASCYHRDRQELGRRVVKIVTENTRWKGHALKKFDRNVGIAVTCPAARGLPRRNSDGGYVLRPPHLASKEAMKIFSRIHCSVRRIGLISFLSRRAGG